MDSVRAEKARLRLLARTRVAAMPRADRDAADAAICGHLGSLVQRELPSFVLAFIALADEPSIAAFLAGVEGGGRTVLVPRVRAGRLHFGEWRAGVAIERDEMGVLAPVDAHALELPQATGLVVVPGRAFDACGRRLGRGGGYYDRLLGGLPSGCLVAGVAYECQVVGAVPSETHDRNVHAIVTELGARPVETNPGKTGDEG
jgi:5-formyltetrahydrofolate cyclo-ligase